MPKKISKEEWEQRIKEAGTGRYEFVRWEVDGEFGSKDKCVLRCIVDGFEWESSVNNLVNHRRGCPQCAGKRRWTADERIEQINSLENIRFISWVDYHKNHRSKANLVCLIDGFEWSSSVGNLVHGKKGCPQCSGVRRWTEDERIEQINSTNEVEFLRWDSNYQGAFSRAIVRCKYDCFEWDVTIANILNHGSRCPKCTLRGYDKRANGTLYSLLSECGKFVKVGISNKPEVRLELLKKRTPFIFSLFRTFESDGVTVVGLEKHFHGKYERAGFTGFDGCTEWLICTPELLEELINLGDK